MAASVSPRSLTRSFAGGNSTRRPSISIKTDSAGCVAGEVAASEVSCAGAVVEDATFARSHPVMSATK
jgi:hypothetical protein